MSECVESGFGTKVHCKVAFTLYFLARACVLLKIILSFAACTFDGEGPETSLPMLDFCDDWGLGDWLDDLDDASVSQSQQRSVTHHAMVSLW